MASGHGNSQVYWRLSVKSKFTHIKVGDLVSHTMDSGPRGVGVVLSTEELADRPHCTLCKFPSGGPRWYHTGYLYFHKFQKK